MKMESVAVTEQKKPTEETRKRAWIEPEITWHKELKAVTLATQCFNTFPTCTSPVLTNI